MHTHIRSRCVAFAGGGSSSTRMAAAYVCVPINIWLQLLLIMHYVRVFGTPAYARERLLLYYTRFT